MRGADPDANRAGGVVELLGRFAEEFLRRRSDFVPTGANFPRFPGCVPRCQSIEMRYRLFPARTHGYVRGGRCADHLPRLGASEPSWRPAERLDWIRPLFTTRCRSSHKTGHARLQVGSAIGSDSPPIFFTCFASGSPPSTRAISSNGPCNTVAWSRCTDAPANSCRTTGTLGCPIRSSMNPTRRVRFGRPLIRFRSSKRWTIGTLRSPLSPRTFLGLV